MEPCGKPGGTQMRLLPFAIVALAVYVCGYPVGLAALFWRKREAMMEDQVLRAMGVGDDKLTNPHALAVRRAFGRSYYAFKPDYFWWAVVVIARKVRAAHRPIALPCRASPSPSPAFPACSWPSR